MVLQKNLKKMDTEKKCHESKHVLRNAQAKHDQTLIELAGIYQQLSPEVANDLAQWLSRSKRKGHQ
jgi:hypothetical protein